MVPAPAPPAPLKSKPVHPPRSCVPPKLAVLLVDVLRTQVKESKVGCLGGTVSTGIERLCALLATARKLGIPVVFVKPHEDFAAQFGLVDIVPALAHSAPDAQVIPKRHGNSFSRTTLSRHLEGFGANTLVIGGWDLRRCVSDTINGAVDRNYRVITSEEICFSEALCDNMKIYPGHLRSLKGSYARTLAHLRAEPAVEYHDRFDELLRVVEKAAST